MSTALTSRILNRLVRPDEPDLTPAMAQHITSFQLTNDERDRVAALAERFGRGELFGDERSNYLAFALLAELLTLIKAKADLSLAAGAGSHASDSKGTVK